MPPELEALAQRLVRSGQLRINADHERNFVRHGTSDSDKTFTARELTDPQLAPRTRRELARHVPPAAGSDAIDALIAQLMGELKKARGIAPEKEMKVARVVVQSAHPSVIQLVLQSGTDLFVSYSHNVADLLALHEWQTHGSAGGLQATSDEGTAVYISCSGDPFFSGEQKTFVTDGFPALARMMVIGGQELGHFADLLRSDDGIIGRHSTDNTARMLRASPAVRAARRSDMACIAQMQVAATRSGLARLLRAESAVGFYAKRMRFSPPWMFCQLWRLLAFVMFYLRSSGSMKHGFRVYPSMRHGMALSTYLSDMAFNLAPDADAYRRSDPEEEEAIACIEALARVPQQVYKWGHAHVQAGWPQLYAIYYHTVIPSCIAACRQHVASPSMPLWQQGWVFVRRLLRPRPQFYPEKQ